MNVPWTLFIIAQAVLLAVALILALLTWQRSLADSKAWLVATIVMWLFSGVTGMFGNWWTGTRLDSESERVRIEAFPGEPGLLSIAFALQARQFGGTDVAVPGLPAVREVLESPAGVVRIRIDAGEAMPSAAHLDGLLREELGIRGFQDRIRDDAVRFGFVGNPLVNHVQIENLNTENSIRGATRLDASVKSSLRVAKVNASVRCVGGVNGQAIVLEFDTLIPPTSNFLIQIRFTDTVGEVLEARLGQSQLVTGVERDVDSPAADVWSIHFSVGLASVRQADESVSIRFEPFSFDDLARLASLPVGAYAFDHMNYTAAKSHKVVNQGEPRSPDVAWVGCTSG